MTATAADRWLDLLTAYAAAERARGIAPSTLLDRTKHVRRFAAALHPLPPDHVTYEDYRGWIDNLAATEHREAKLRTSLRAFFRWASAAGRIHHDPTAEPEYVTRKAPVPSAWADELEAFRGYQRSIGRPRTTIATYGAELARFARDHPRLPPAQVSTADILDWMATKRWATETRRGHRTALRAFYRWMHTAGRVDVDPADALPVVRRATHLPRPALEAEYARALERADDREKVALRLAAELGMRCAEVAGLHSRDLLSSDDGPLLRVHGKGSRDRDIPLTDNLARMLRTLPAGYAFPGQYDGHLSPNYLSKLISRLLPPGVAMHALRHRFASRAYNTSGDLLTVQQLLGHASPQTTMVYVQLDQASRRRLIQATAI